MSQARKASRGKRDQIDAVALRQWGITTFAQLGRRGIDKDAIARRVRSGELSKVHRGVYSTVHPRLMSYEACLAAAVLAGGPGACLCDRSAAHLLGLLPSRPSTIHVAVAKPRRPQAGITFHRLSLRPEEVVRHRRLPTTSPERTLLDLAAHLDDWSLRRAMAEAEFHHGLEAEGLIPVLRKGHAGSAALRAAIARHMPELAATRSELEREFLRFCEAYGFPIPLVNHDIRAATVDALFDGVAVELDGVRAHAGERRLLRDHRRDLHRRADGLTPLRYHYAQLVHEPALIAADLERAGVRRLSARAPAARPRARATR